VIVELLNDSATTDGAGGGQWVVTTTAEAMEPVLAHRWEGTSLALKKPDGSWGDWVNLQGPQGVRGPAGSVSAEGYNLDIVFSALQRDWNNKNFDGNNLNGITIWPLEGSVSNTSFKNSRMKNVHLQSDFLNCDFSGADLLFDDTGATSFVDCNFKGANLFIIKQNWKTQNDEVVSWKEYLKINHFGDSLSFTNCIMPDGSQLTYD